MLSSLGSFEHSIGFSIFRNAAAGEAICTVLLNMKQNKFFFCMWSFVRHLWGTAGWGGF